MAIGVINDTLLTNIAEAIRSKNLQETTYLPSEMPAAIEAIETGIDTSDATATAEDMAEGVTAYVNGEKITGNVPHEDRTYGQAPVLTEDNKVSLYYSASFEKRMVGGGKKLTITSALSNFGNVTPEDVATGKTFTSTSGILATGTVPRYSGINLTYDSLTDNGSTVTVQGLRSSRVILTEGGNAKTKVPLSEFGDAASSDVVEGVTFTSANGLKVSGSLQTGLDSNVGAISYIEHTSIIDGEEITKTRQSEQPDARILYKTVSVDSSGKIVLSDPLSETASTFSDQNENYATYPYFYGDYNDGTSDATVYRYADLYKSSITGGGFEYYYTYYKQNTVGSICMTATADSDAVIRAESAYDVHASAAEFGDAMAEHVAIGKTFTSAAGFNITGTMVTYGEDVTNMHIWGKYTIVDDAYIETEVEDYLIATVGLLGESSTVHYANEISVLNNDISLIDKQTITFTMDDDVDTTLSVIKGKYVGTDIVGYAFIPSDASLYMAYPDDDQAYKNLLASKAIKIEANTSALNPELLGYVGSNVDTTYPVNGEQNGYTYVYVGTLKDCIEAE